MNTVFAVMYDYYVTGEQPSVTTGRTTYVIVKDSDDIKEALLIAEEKIPEQYAQLPTQELTVVITDITRVGELLN